ncbi:MAG: type II secretion system GspH family protein [Bdellovibrionaceae bacterium]|nr:type II secretion system GspH family protein [Pseudobdellovibrionaceae bacterium]NUM58763.1 type II secretion system protein [Pseudobdellovibrionaceae bacterium]
MRVKKNTRHGFSIIEVLLGLVIITIVGSSSAYLLVKSKQSVNQVIVKSTKNTEFSNLIDTIRQNIDIMQIHYDSSSSMAISKLTKENMPWAFDKYMIYPVSDCLNCSGRFGYIIQPSKTIRSLYDVKLRIYHESLGDQFLEYSFIVSSK